MKMRARAWCTATAIVFLLLTVPPIFAGLATMFQHGDMVKFHLPQINYHIQHPLDLLHYEASSATTPGHHFLFAWVSILFGYDSVSENTMVLRLLNVVIALGLIVVAWMTFYRLKKDALFATACALPLVGSNYVLTAAIWINTDNGAMLFFALTLFSMLFYENRVYLAAISVLLMVMWRQIYLPVVGALAFPVLLPGDRKKTIVRAIATVLPTVIVIGVYASAWGGLTPGTTQLYNKFTLNLSVPLHAVALTGLFALPYGLLLKPTFTGLDPRGRKIVLGVGVAIGLILWLIAASNHDNEMGRWGSLIWVLAKKSPGIGDKTFVVLLLAIAGATTLAAMGWRAIAERYYPIELMMLLAYFAGYSAQVFAWQRYIEPAIFLVIGVHCARTKEATPRFALAGPALMAAIFGLMSQLRIWGTLGQMFG
ncbi:MAG: hypothetical protein RMA76_06855 [Deltaproteobacteria bacterium]|jgi:hypothetical protein